MALVLNIQPNVIDGIITVSNTNYTDFKSFTVNRTIDDVCGSFNIEISRPIDNPFRVGKIIDVVVHGVQLMRGKIYNIALRGNAREDNIVIAGRDITGDLVDSTVPDDAKVYEAGVNIFDIAGKIIKSLGLDLTVFNNTGGEIEPFGEEEIVSCEAGQTAIEFLQDYCRKRQLFLVTNEFGGLEFFKATGQSSDNRLINLENDVNNNLLSWDTSYNSAERFWKYICKTQDESDYGTSVDFSGTAFDGQIDMGREFEFILEEAGSQKECADRAAEESNVRRARSFEYAATVQGFKDKSVWRINQSVFINDFFSAVKGFFLVKAVEYKLDVRTGTTTRVTCTNPDAYTAQAAIDAREAKTSSSGDGWD